MNRLFTGINGAGFLKKPQHGGAAAGRWAPLRPLNFSPRRAERGNLIWLLLPVTTASEASEG